MHFYHVPWTELYKVWPRRRVFAFFENIVSHRFVEQYPTMRLTYLFDVFMRSWGKSKAMPSFTTYWEGMVPRGHDAAKAIYSPRMVESFTLAMKRGIVDNAMLAALDTAKLRASGWGSS